ncbi:YdcF family protein [Limosilactobacillus fermentum]
MHRFARQKGVPKSAIRLETNSTNTATNLSEAKRFINSGDRVVLVTSDYHLLRSLLYARRQGVNSGPGRPHPPLHLYLQRLHPRVGGLPDHSPVPHPLRVSVGDYTLSNLKTGCPVDPIFKNNHGHR